jgi:methyl-accepting chemotaxis protein
MKWFLNMNIGKKLIIAFLFVATVTAVVGGVGMVNLQNVAKEDRILYEMFTVPLEQMGNLKEAYQLTRVNARDMLMNRDGRQQNDIIARINDNLKEMRTEVDKIGTTMVSDEGRKLHKDLQTTTGEYEAYLKRVIAVIQSGQMEQAYLMMQTEGVKMAEKFDAMLARLGFLKVDLAKKKADENASNANRAMIIMIAFVAAGALLAIGLGIFIARAVSQPVREMVAVAGRIADGDLNVEANAKYRDEIGELAKAFNVMVQNINEVMTNINASAEQVAAGSKQMSDSSMALSQGATEQASSDRKSTRLNSSH